LTIFRPWFMDRPPSALEGDESGLVRVLRPPADLKPKGDIKALLSGYKDWMRASPDKSTIAFLKAGGGRGGPEDTTWEIRGALRQRGDAGKRPEEDPSLKWHLLLHLAQELEDGRRDADQVLGALREKGSPLRGAVEEEDLKGLFTDLPEFDADLVLDDTLLGQVYEAWFSLFKGQLKGHDLLVTMDHRIMEHVSDLWEEYGDWEGGAPESKVAFRFPDLSHLGPGEFLKIKGRLDMKTGEAGEIIPDLWQDPTTRLSRLEAWFREAENEWPWDLSSGALNITLRHFSPYSVTKHREKERVLRDLFGKTMILVESKEIRHERS